MRQLVDAMLAARAIPQPQQAAALGSPAELPPRSAVLRHLVARLQCGLDAATQAEPPPTMTTPTPTMTMPTVTSPTMTTPTMNILIVASTPRRRRSTSRRARACWAPKPSRRRAPLRARPRRRRPQRRRRLRSGATRYASWRRRPPARGRGRRARRSCSAPRWSRAAAAASDCSNGGSTCARGQTSPSCCCSPCGCSRRAAWRRPSASSRSSCSAASSSCAAPTCPTPSTTGGTP